jgi:hypothetical protein
VPPAPDSALIGASGYGDLSCRQRQDSVSHASGLSRLASLFNLFQSDLSHYLANQYISLNVY